MQLVSRTLSRDQTVGHPWYGQPSRSQSSVCLNNVCAETQTRRFKAIVAGASVYQDPAVYAKSSPITFIEHSHTPVLILQANATRKFRPQAFEFYNAMQALHVPSRLVVYADEGHGPRKPENQIDILDRIVGWFGTYLH